MHAERCPVCSGNGVVRTNDIYSKEEKDTKVCHGCDGKGWVEVRDEPLFIPNSTFNGIDNAKP